MTDPWIALRLDDLYDGSSGDDVHVRAHDILTVRKGRCYDGEYGTPTAVHGSTLLIRGLTGTAIRGQNLTTGGVTLHVLNSVEDVLALVKSKETP